MNISLAVLMTCFNRRETTLQCLEALTKQVLSRGLSMEIYLVDDGCSDDTSEAIAARYPRVKILKGTGNLYWAGGMRLAFAEALKKDYDFYLWLNDDTLLFPGALDVLINTYEQVTTKHGELVLVAGSISDPQTGKMTYGGVVRSSRWHPFRYKNLFPSGKAERCDTFEGNCALIPRAAAKLIGNVDPVFTHYGGDTDYGLRLSRKGGSVWSTPTFVGSCRKTIGQGQCEEYLNSSLVNKFMTLCHPKGLPPNEWKTLTRRHGGWMWPILFMLPYRRLFYCPIKRDDGMSKTQKRIAFLFPTMKGGLYHQPVLRKFALRFPETIVFTGVREKFIPGFQDTFKIVEVGKARFIHSAHLGDLGLPKHFYQLSLKIIPYLLKFRPAVIYATAFSLWTIIAVVLKPFLRCRLVILYDGGSPNTDLVYDRVRTLFRRMMVRCSEAIIANTERGKKYLVEVLKARDRDVLVNPYEVPDPEVFAKNKGTEIDIPCVHPVFLYVGRMVVDKGIQHLVEAVSVLLNADLKNFTIWLVGEGPMRNEWERLVRDRGLNDYVRWFGFVDYHCLGPYFRQADVLVLPSFEDTWGMVVTEAMLFGKAVICSREAGVSEIIREGENGFVINCGSTEELAAAMKKFLMDPALAGSMGLKSKEIIAHYTTESAVLGLARAMDRD